MWKNLRGCLVSVALSKQTLLGLTSWPPCLQHLSRKEKWLFLTTVSATKRKEQEWRNSRVVLSSLAGMAWSRKDRHASLGQLAVISQTLRVHPMQGCQRGHHPQQPQSAFKLALDDASLPIASRQASGGNLWCSAAGATQTSAALANHRM